MPDLPSVEGGAINAIRAQIEAIRRGGSGSNPSPHKLLMLLAVLELADSGLLAENKIRLDDELTRRYEVQHRLWASPRDWCQPGPPYFHLRSSGFWAHKVKPGREAVYEKLTTTGGGTKWILDNIEYAYLSDEAYAVFGDIEGRGKLKTFIESLLGNRVSKVRLSTMFHESIPFNNGSISQTLAAICAADGDIDLTNLPQREAVLRELTQYGPNYVKAVPQYAFGAGLLDSHYRLTLFGSFVHTYDRSLGRIESQWLMHYHLSAPHGPGPAFWHDLVANRFRTGSVFTRDDLADQISAFFVRTEGKPLAARSAQSTATIFLGTYTKDEGLGKLGLVEDLGGNRYRIGDPDPPPVWAVGYALLDFWQAQFGASRLSINLDTLSEPYGFAGSFLMGAGRLNMMLHALLEVDYVDVHRVAPPYQVVLLHQDPEPLLQRLYGTYDPA